MTFKEYIKKIKRKMPPFVSKEGLPSWIEDAYMHGYNQAAEEFLDKGCTWLKQNKDNVETEDNGIAGWISEDFIKDFRNSMKVQYETNRK